MKKSILRVAPFLTIFVIMLFAWYEIATTEYTASAKNYMALILVITNGVLYWLRYKQAILFTGVILVLATFNWLSFFTVTQSSYIGINIGSRQINTPEIQWKSLLLLTIYCAINLGFLIEWYLDIKEKKVNRRAK